jgi:hypothetical protein
MVLSYSWSYRILITVHLQLQTRPTSKKASSAPDDEYQSRTPMTPLFVLTQSPPSPHDPIYPVKNDPSVLPVHTSILSAINTSHGTLLGSQSRRVPPRLHLEQPRLPRVQIPHFGLLLLVHAGLSSASSACPHWFLIEEGKGGHHLESCLEGGEGMHECSA